MVAIYARAARDGLLVARVHSGDPTLYGALHEQIEECRRLGLSYEIVLTFERAGQVPVILPVSYPGEPRPPAETE